MNQQNQQSEEQKEKPKFNHWQYKYLKLCSQKGDVGIKRWNEWREKKPDKEIWLEGAKFNNLYLMGINLKNAHLQEAIFIIKVEGNWK